MLNSFFTVSEIAFPAASPARDLVATPITLPISFIPSGFISSIASLINSSTSLSVNGFGKIKLATSEVIASYKRMFEDSKSDYYIGINGEASMFEVYNSFTEGISNDNNKDIMNKFEKCVLLKKILNL